MSALIWVKVIFVEAFYCFSHTFSEEKIIPVCWRWIKHQFVWIKTVNFFLSSFLSSLSNLYIYENFKIIFVISSIWCTYPTNKSKFVYICMRLNLKSLCFKTFIHVTIEVMNLLKISILRKMAWSTLKNYYIDKVWIVISLRPEN